MKAKKLLLVAVVLMLAGCTKTGTQFNRQIAMRLMGTGDKITTTNIAWGSPDGSELEKRERQRMLEKIGLEARGRILGRCSSFTIDKNWVLDKPGTDAASVDKDNLKPGVMDIFVLEVDPKDVSEIKKTCSLLDPYMWLTFVDMQIGDLNLLVILGYFQKKGYITRIVALEEYVKRILDTRAKAISSGM